jgi:hypothetical protein
MYIRIVSKPINWFHKSRDQRRKGEINAIVSAPLNRQNYGPCQYGTPSLNISPVHKPENEIHLLGEAECAWDMIWGYYGLYKKNEDGAVFGMLRL